MLEALRAERHAGMQGRACNGKKKSSGGGAGRGKDVAAAVAAASSGPSAGALAFDPELWARARASRSLKEVRRECESLLKVRQATGCCA